MYVESEKDFEAFWAQCALDLDWFSKWDHVLDWNPPYAKWFESGTINVSYNCLDRHILSGKGSKTAFISINERGSKRFVTYEALYEEVNKIANLLKSFHVEKGDRVAIYMPMVPEAIASMLACSRIGAIHLVIFGGMGAQSVKDRVLETEAKVMITADGAYRAGKIIPYKSEIDIALNECPSVEKVIVLKHTDSSVNMISGREVWYHEAIANCDGYCEPEKMGAEDPLFILCPPVG